MSSVKTKAILSRSNVGLLTYLVENIPFSHKYYIEGGVKSIIKTSSGFSIIDMYHLKENKNHLITNKVVNNFTDYADFIQYYMDVDDILVMSFIDFLNSFTGDIVSSVSYIENNIVSDLKEADIVLSTIHKAKGKEWDYVKILGSNTEENFPHTLPKYKSEIKRYKDNSIFRQFIEYLSQDSDPLLSEEEVARIKDNWLEEINLYYVGATRAKKILEHNVFWMKGL
jgi:superfamily I DNA/RNA helicase